MGILVTDFDGTLTRFDFFDLVRRRWPLPPDRDPWERYVAGKTTHFEALAEIFRGIRASESEVEELIAEMEFDPLAGEAIRRLTSRGWEVVIASAGCDWYIRRILARAGIAVTVHANPGVFDPARGLMMKLPLTSPYFDSGTGIDKLGIVEAALAETRSVAFAGDGRPDWEPALRVAPERRFARGWLAEALAERGEGYHRLETWADLADRLS